MLLVAVVLFLLAATFGLALLTSLLQDRPANKSVTLFHGLFAVMAILIMIIYLFLFDESTLFVSSLILFILAALGGLTLFTLGMKKKKFPKWLVILHPFIAVAGLIVLVICVLP